MKKIMCVIAAAVVLSGCAGSSVGVGAGTGFPGIGLGAGLSFPIGGGESKDKEYIAEIHDLVKSKIENVRAFSGKECTVRLTADKDGLLADVKRMDGDARLCDAVMNAFYSFNKLPVPPASMVDSLKSGLIVSVQP